MTKTGTLFLIPTPLAESGLERVQPPYNKKLIQSLPLFFVEHKKTARKFLKACEIPPPFESIEFRILDKKTALQNDFEVLEPFFTGRDAGIISEAGIPGIADPGAELVRLCHQNGIPVKPLTGPSSVFLALTGSGLNGQLFTFHGYLSVKSNERQKQLKNLEKASENTGYTQIFMETPYRNDQLLAAILKACKSDTLLCIACDLTAGSEEILTLPVSDWKAMDKHFHKQGYG